MNPVRNPKRTMINNTIVSSHCFSISNGVSTRKTVLILSALSFFAIASTALAQGFIPLAPITGLTDETTATSIMNSKSFANFFNNLYKYCIGLSAVLAVIMIIWGGLEYATQDVPGSKQNGKEKIQQAILGLVLVLSPVLVFSIINPSILSLSLNLERINTDFTPAPVRDASVPYTTGTGNPCGGINTGANCTQTVFNEGTYLSPPPGAACYELANPIPTGQTGEGDRYMCFRQLTGAMGCNNILSSNSDMGVTARKAGLTTCTQY